MNPENPKRQFQRLHPDLAKRHADWTAGLDFQILMNYTMLEVVDELADPRDGNQAAAQRYALHGARVFRNFLMTLADPIKEPPQVPNDNLQDTN